MSSRVLIGSLLPLFAIYMVAIDLLSGVYFTSAWEVLLVKLRWAESDLVLYRLMLLCNLIIPY